MAVTHYQTLGVRPTATQAEIRSAYRRLVLRHHPARSKDPGSPERLMAATDAYDVLSDPLLRLRYDESLEAEAKRHASHQVAEKRAEAAAQSSYGGGSNETAYASPTEAPPARVAADLQRLTTLFSQGRHVDAERLARSILAMAPKTPIPYAVLGDIARTRGDFNETAKMYAYAAQFDPGNFLYQQRYEELLASSLMVEDKKKRTRIVAEDRKVLAPLAGGFVVFCAAWYLLLFDGGGPFFKHAAATSWSVGLVTSLLLSGICLGASLASGNMLDRFRSQLTTTTGRPGPILALAGIAMLNFWVAGALYVFIGALQHAFNFSTTRLLSSVATALLVLTAAYALSGRDSSSVLAWGGNLVFLGAMLGWAVADVFRTLS